MKRNLYTRDEIILCTYIARFGRKEFTEEDISKLRNRSVSSIKMKVQNIAAMLAEEGYSTDPNINPLSGRPPGEKGRRTNWDIIEPIVEDDKRVLYEECQRLLDVEGA